jgi:hypothetical protein
MPLADDDAHPAGSGIGAMPATVPLNAWAVPLAPPLPTIWPELLMPVAWMDAVHPAGSGMGLTEYVEAAAHWPATLLRPNRTIPIEASLARRARAILGKINLGVYHTLSGQAEQQTFRGA